MKSIFALSLTLIAAILFLMSGIFMSESQAAGGFSNGWPDLVISIDHAGWRSFADYEARNLTVSFTLVNSNPAAAHGVLISGATSTSGVSLKTAVPVNIGDIAAGGSVNVDMVFGVPVGVHYFFTSITGSADGSPSTLNPNPPALPVKLVFVHHSTGENWLTDGNGDLGTTLTDYNYFVSDTNYGWGPADADAGGGTIGDHTDIGHWYNWFAGPHRDTYMTALFAESGQHSSYTRMASDPGGANEIIMFKSCFPNSALGGSPGDAATAGVNPLRGQDAWSGAMTVANVKGIYNDLLPYFAVHQEKLFIVITAPPLDSGSTDASQAANARAVNNWLVEDWLSGYSYNNVAVFDFYNVLTSNGGNADTSDLGLDTGNHHRYELGAIVHLNSGGGNYSAYTVGGDSHPTAAGGQKATGEFVTWLNVAYNRWQGI